MVCPGDLDHIFCGLAEMFDLDQEKLRIEGGDYLFNGKEKLGWKKRKSAVEIHREF